MRPNSLVLTMLLLAGLLPLLPGCGAFDKLSNKHVPNESQVTALYALPLEAMRTYFAAAFDEVSLERQPTEIPDTLRAQARDAHNPAQILVVLQQVATEDGTPLTRASITSTYVMRQPSTFTHTPIALVEAVSAQIGIPPRLQHLVPQAGFPTEAGCDQLAPASAISPTPEDTSAAETTMPRLPGGLASIQHLVTYTNAAMKAGIEGQVYLQFIADETGAVRCAEVLSGLPHGLNEVALNALTAQTFEPALRGGKPIEMTMRLPITFFLY